VPRDRRRWHHIVLTTYGAWLYGDARGFRTRHHREHVDGDYKNPPPRGLYDDKARRSRDSLVQPPVVIPHRYKACLGRAMWRELTKRRVWVLIMAVSGQHVHLLVKVETKRVRHLAGRAKRCGTLELRSKGWQGRLCGRSWQGASHPRSRPSRKRLSVYQAARSRGGVDRNLESRSDRSNVTTRLTQGRPMEACWQGSGLSRTFPGLKQNCTRIRAGA